MERRGRTDKNPSENPRAKHSRFKEQVVVTNGYLNKRLASQRIAEFDYQLVTCDRTFHVIVIRKEVHLNRGQMRLLDKQEPVYFFYITNAAKKTKPTRQVVFATSGTI